MAHPTVLVQVYMAATQLVVVNEHNGMKSQLTDTVLKLNYIQHGKLYSRLPVGWLVDFAECKVDQSNSPLPYQPIPTNFIFMDPLYSSYHSNNIFNPKFWGVRR